MHAHMKSYADALIFAALLQSTALSHVCAELNLRIMHVHLKLDVVALTSTSALQLTALSHWHALSPKTTDACRQTLWATIVLEQVS